MRTLYDNGEKGGRWQWNVQRVWVAWVRGARIGGVGLAARYRAVRPARHRREPHRSDCPTRHTGGARCVGSAIWSAS